LGTLGAWHFLGLRKLGSPDPDPNIKKVSPGAGFSIIHGSVPISTLYAIWGHREGVRERKKACTSF